VLIDMSAEGHEFLPSSAITCIPVT
jgi:hypothetical protein